MKKGELGKFLTKHSETFNINLIDATNYGHENSWVSICRIGNLFLFISVDPKTDEITLKIGHGYLVTGYENLLEVPLLYKEALDVLRGSISKEKYVELRNRVDGIKSSDDLEFILNNSLAKIIEKSADIKELEKKVLPLYRGRLVLI